MCTPLWTHTNTCTAFRHGAKEALLATQHAQQAAFQRALQEQGCTARLLAHQTHSMDQCQTLTAAGSRPPQRPTGTHTTGIPHRRHHCPRSQRPPLQSRHPLWRTACGRRSARSHPLGKGSSLAHWRSMSHPAPADRCPSSLAESLQGFPEGAGCMAAQVTFQYVRLLAVGACQRVHPQVSYAVEAGLPPLPAVSEK